MNVSYSFSNTNLPAIDAVVVKDFVGAATNFGGGGNKECVAVMEMLSGSLIGNILDDDEGSMADVGVAVLKPTNYLKTTYPNKVFDYMAAGKPTILSIEGVIKDVIEKSNGGTAIPPENTKDMKNAILEYYKNPQKGIQEGKNAQTYVQKHFKVVKTQKTTQKLKTYFKTQEKP